MGKREKSKIEKSVQKEQKRLEKRLKKLETKNSEPSIEEMLHAFQSNQNRMLQTTATLSDVPSPRSHFLFVSCPDSAELILFGGEYFDGKKVTMFADLYIYSTKDNKWWLINSPNTPSPRSGHHGVYVKTSSVHASVWIFGGEFSSQSQSRFHHYNDLWCLRVKSRKWERINATGPCARSGHRMVFSRNHIIIFGGFSDVGSKTIYFNDLWEFSLSNQQWTSLKLSGDVPSPRSGCLFYAGPENKLYVVGGYSKTPITRDTEVGICHSDIIKLTIEKDTSFVTCHSIRPSGIRPKPPRSSMAGVNLNGYRVVIFGGVHDVESIDGETFKSYFHNDMFLLDLDKGKWHEHKVCANKTGVPATSNNSYACFAESHSQEEISTSALSNIMHNTVIGQNVTSLFTDISNKTDASNVMIPTPRSSAGMALYRSNLYVYGGVFEADNRKITLNDFYHLDINHSNTWNCLHAGNQENQVWLESESEDDLSGDENEPNQMVVDNSSQDEDDDNSDDDDDDEELVENAPLPLPSETFTRYWERTKQFWCELVQKGTNDTDDQEPVHATTSITQLKVPVDANSVIIKLARNVATDFYKTNNPKSMLIG